MRTYQDLQEELRQKQARRMSYTEQAKLIGGVTELPTLWQKEIYTKPESLLPVSTPMVQQPQEFITAALAQLITPPELRAPFLFQRGEEAGVQIPRLQEALPLRFYQPESDRPFVGHLYGALGLGLDIVLDPIFWATAVAGVAPAVGREAEALAPRAIKRALAAHPDIVARYGEETVDNALGRMTSWIGKHMAEIPTEQIGAVEYQYGKAASRIAGAPGPTEALVENLRRIAKSAGVVVDADNLPLAETAVRNLQLVWSPQIRARVPLLSRWWPDLQIGAKRLPKEPGLAATTTRNLMKDMEVIGEAVKTSPVYESFKRVDQWLGMPVADLDAATNENMQNAFRNVLQSDIFQQPEFQKRWANVVNTFRARGEVPASMFEDLQILDTNYRTLGTNFNRELDAVMRGRPREAPELESLISQLTMRRPFQVKNDIEANIMREAVDGLEYAPVSIKAGDTVGMNVEDRVRWALRQADEWSDEVMETAGRTPQIDLDAMPGLLYMEPGQLEAGYRARYPGLSPGTAGRLGYPVGRTYTAGEDIVQRTFRPTDAEWNALPAQWKMTTDEGLHVNLQALPKKTRWLVRTESELVKMMRRRLNDVRAIQQDVLRLTGLSEEQAAEIGIGDLGSGYWHHQMLYARQMFDRNKSAIPAEMQRMMHESRFARPIESIMMANEQMEGPVYYAMDPRQVFRAYHQQVRSLNLYRDLLKFAKTHGAEVRPSALSSAVGWAPLGRFGPRVLPNEPGLQDVLEYAGGVLRGNEGIVGMNDYLFPHGVHRWLEKNIVGDIYGRQMMGTIQRNFRGALSVPRRLALWATTWLNANAIDQATSMILSGVQRPQDYLSATRLAMGVYGKDIVESLDITEPRTWFEAVKASQAKRLGEWLNTVSKGSKVYNAQLLDEAAQMRGQGMFSWLRHGSGLQEEGRRALTGGMTAKATTKINEATRYAWRELNEAISIPVRVGGATEDFSRQVQFLAMRLNGMSRADATRRIWAGFVNYAPSAMAPVDAWSRDLMYFWTYYRQRSAQLIRAGVEKPWAVAAPYLLRKHIMDNEYTDPEYQHYFKGLPDYVRYQFDAIPRTWSAFPFNTVKDDLPDWVKKNFIPTVRYRLSALEMAGDMGLWLGVPKLLSQGRTDIVYQTMRRTNPFIQALWNWEQGNPDAAVNSLAAITGRLKNILQARKDVSDLPVERLNQIRRKYGFPKLSSDNPFNEQIDTQLWHLEQIRRAASNAGVLLDFHYVPKMVEDLEVEDWFALNQTRTELGRPPLAPSEKQRRQLRQKYGYTLPPKRRAPTPPIPIELPRPPALPQLGGL